MKYKYLVFAYDCYYPSGGFNDFVFGVNNLEEFIDSVNKIQHFDEYYYMLNLLNLEYNNIGNFDYLGSDSRNKDEMRKILIDSFKDITTK